MIMITSYRRCPVGHVLAIMPQAYHYWISCDYTMCTLSVHVLRIELEAKFKTRRLYSLCSLCAVFGGTAACTIHVLTKITPANAKDVFPAGVQRRLCYLIGLVEQCAKYVWDLSTSIHGGHWSWALRSDNRVFEVSDLGPDFCPTEATSCRFPWLLLLFTRASSESLCAMRGRQRSSCIRFWDLSPLWCDIM